MSNILSIIEQYSHSSFTAIGSRYRGPCPFCGGKDRFNIFPYENRYKCFSERYGHGCGKSGDVIQFLRDYKGMSYADACKAVGEKPKDYSERVEHRKSIKVAQRVNAPHVTWQEQAQIFLEHCQGTLWSSAGTKALSWLHERGLTNETISAAGLGYNPVEDHVRRESWGLEPELRIDGQQKSLWLPRGIVIPWTMDGSLWGVRIRRPIGDPKYYFVPGGEASGLYGADSVRAGQPVVVFEGEFDSLSVKQSGYTAVATGSTMGSRRAKWVARLGTCSIVLIAYDNDEAGECASSYWLAALNNARRWRPMWDDANQMLRDGADLSVWVKAGLRTNGLKIARTEPALVEITSPQIAGMPKLSNEEGRLWDLWERYHMRPWERLDDDEYIEMCQLGIKTGLWYPTNDPNRPWVHIARLATP